ncbi:MAG: hypothetical protein JNK82_34490 [Myxococcaceae bacterium]|nr:hypothetical protein [Myxococcaceae bacterium]
MTKSLGFKAAALVLSLGLTACGGPGVGKLTVLLESEDTITSGLQAGAAVENIKDGWKADYSKFIVAIGDIEVFLSTNKAIHTHADDVFVVDLKTVPASGLPLWNLNDLQAGSWDFNYATPGAADGATKHESVTQADFDAMKAADATYLIAGTLTKADGRSCPPASLAMPGAKTSTGMNAAGVACYTNTSVAFSFTVGAETTYGPCEVDEMPGFSITRDATQTVTATLHGDHLFFNGFPEGAEGGVTRLAQWLADCDLNLDGTVTKAELEAITPSMLSELDTRYQLGGSPITPVDNMWTYVRAQLKTQGHMNGEGECPIDGTPHMH